MKRGFIKLNRKSFAHKFWTKARVLSEFEAWIDLIQSARYDETVQIEYIDGREFTYGRGQFPASIRFLAKRWSWGEQRVRTFLSHLTKDGSISIDTSQGMNVITLCNYEKFNTIDHTKNTDDSTPNNVDMCMVLRELKELKAQVKTQATTSTQHTANANSKKEKKERIINTPYSPPKGYEDIDFDFVADGLRNSFFLWLDYKASKGQRYKNTCSIELCYKQLLLKSGGSTTTFVAIIEQSMANNWNGLFKLKQLQDNANTNQFTSNIEKPTDYTICM